MSEFGRVLKGLGMVVDHMVKRNGPEMQKRVERITYHLAELLKAAQEVSRSQQEQQSQPTDQKYESTANAKPKVEKPIDLIGFDSLTENDIKVDVTSISGSSEMNKPMRERPVPSTQFGRLFGFGSLAVRLAVGEAVGRASQVLSGQQPQRSSLSDENAERLAESLCRMRGAALKLGQMLSIQDEASLPPSLAKALERVKHAADYMPKRQLENQLVSHLGTEWRSRFLEFDDIPIAAASIGQVHKAKLLDGTPVAVKIQYPGVAESIESDLQNLQTLVNVTNLLPPGLFLDNIIKVASTELTLECKLSPPNTLTDSSITL